MLKNIVFCLVGICLFLVSCQNEKEIRAEARASVDSLVALDNLRKEIVGNWETLSFHTSIKTANNKDSSYSIYAGKGEWEAKLGVKPFRTSFKENNTYEMEFRDLADSIMETKRGIWNVFGDSLLMIEEDGTYQYRIRGNKDYLEFKSTLDWDGDGVEDDEYMRIEQRVKEN